MSTAVSVIIPAYNAEKWLARTLDSVLQQTMSDFEILVVDDGSTDGTSRIVETTATRDRRVRLIRQANAGAAAARNRAIREATGALIAPLDADDLWGPTFLQTMIEALEQHEGATFAFCPSVWIDAEDRAETHPPRPLPPVVDYRELLLRNPVGNASCTLMRAEHLRAVGGYDEELSRRHSYAEDWLTTLRLSWRGAVVTVDQPLVFYRVHAASASYALTKATRGVVWALAAARRDGPRLPLSTYWEAKSLSAIWLLRRARRAGDLALCARLGAMVFLQDPLWPFRPASRALAMAPLRRLAQRVAANRTHQAQPRRTPDAL